jgi:(1->4)-alpha-D-glucan 1-alpha-D-glucosylmutase
LTLRVPAATYRIQFNASFRFADAIGILDYLRGLGISHLYASPVLASRTGSNHGYDVADPTKIDPELGGEQDFVALQAALEERGMGLLLDIVPNHMAAGSENRWWMDVLEFGPDSAFASYFDIDWRPPARSLKNKLLLPFLEKTFGEALDAGDFKLACDDGKFFLRYGEQTFPIAPRSYAEILWHCDVKELGTAESHEAREWEGIRAAADSIAADPTLGTQAAAERRTKFERLRDRLRQLVSTSAETAAFVHRALEKIGGAPGSARNFCDLEHILSQQHYRLAFWQTASDAINYRRFFSITDLVGVRVEDPSVFDATHETVIRLAGKGGTGFRIDHVDGLLDPLGYLTRLQERLSPPDSENGKTYVVVEKILERNEDLPADWPCHGTTGYDYLNFANRLFVEEHKASALRQVYERWIRSTTDFPDLLYQKKKLVMRTLLAVEMRSLGRQLVELSRDDRYAREIPPADLMEVLIEVTACLSVYRTYVRGFEETPAEREVIAAAIQQARERRSALPAICYDFLSDVLLLASPEHVSPLQRESRLAFVTRWQQFTGPIVAKGLEDTTLYIYFPLASLNEVGGDPRVEKAHPLAFHDFIARRCEKWPGSMNATTTHDTKRSEDVRARISVLSEIPGEWERALAEWSRINERFMTRIDDATVPDRNEEYLFYQTLVGAWPLDENGWSSFVPRMQEYFVKATREAMLRTRWTRPNERHEGALHAFIANVLDRAANPEFFAGFENFHERIAIFGMLNGLSQALLKVACPGVPDVYQGSELWDLRLVDPDNRGPVDFSARAAFLAGLDDAQCQCSRQANDLLHNWRDGRVKLHVIKRAMAARNADLDLFLKGSYRPLAVSGSRGGRCVAFAREYDGRWAVVAVPRCIASEQGPVLGSGQDGGRGGFWNGCQILLPAATPRLWKNALAGADSNPIDGTDVLPLKEVFAGFPVALLLPVPV